MKKMVQAQPSEEGQTPPADQAVGEEGGGEMMGWR